MTSWTTVGVRTDERRAGLVLLGLALAACGGGGPAYTDADPTGTADAMTDATVAPDAPVDAPVDAAPPDAEVMAGPVTPLYPTSGAGWNDYVANDGASVTAATDTACDPTQAATARDACLHGGELRAFTPPGVASCAGVTATDELAAFEWLCEEQTGGGVRVYSRRLRPGKYLSDLIDFAPATPTWRTNRVTVSVDGTATVVSPATQWWTNPIVVASTSVLDTAGAIYVVTTPLAERFFIDAPRIAWVVQPGVVVPGAVDTDVVTARNGTDFLWFEGAIDATDDQRGLRIAPARFTVVRNLRVTRGTVGATCDTRGLGSAVGIAAAQCTQCSFVDVTLINHGGGGLSVNGAFATIDNLRVDCNAQGLFLGDQSNGSRVSNVVAVRNSSVGIQTGPSSGLGAGVAGPYDVHLTNLFAAASGRHNMLLDGTRLTVRGLYSYATTTFADGDAIQYGFDRSVVSDVVAIGARNDGINVGPAVDNIFSNVLVANNGRIGMRLGSGTMVVGVTSVGNVQYGIETVGTRGAIIGAAAVNNGLDGIRLQGGGGHTLLNVASSSNGDDTTSVYDLRVVGSFTEANQIVGRKLLGLQSCKNDATVGSPAGLTDACNDDVPGNDPSIYTEIPWFTFVGPLAQDDAVNASDTLGAASFAAITDFVGFARAYRGYAKDGPTGNDIPFPGTTFRGPCLVAETCRIWDYNLSTLDVYLKARLTWPTSDNANLPLVVTHTFSSAITSAQVCDELPGAAWDAGTSRCTITFLNQAFEASDGPGNRNGLCESGETCVFTPNFGVYQGHGARSLLEAELASGGLTGIRLERYDSNGH